MGASIEEHFSELTDPRRREGTYPLINIVVIGIFAVLCGSDDFVATAEFGRTKRKWLERLLDLSTGIPSHHRFNAILGAMRPAAFEACLLSWIRSLHEITEGQVIAIDGKTLRRSFDKASSKAAIHMVSDWASQHQISLGQVVVDKKSNEVTAIPQLLKILEIKGCLVTIDAMGLQVEIAKQILEPEADYVLAVKKNQPTLHQGNVDHFVEHLPDDFATTNVGRYRPREKGHGRVETREYFVCPVSDDLPDKDRWPQLKAIGLVRSEVQRNGKEETEFRYHIMSRQLPARRFAEAVRTHWSIENQLHW